MTQRRGSAPLIYCVHTLLERELSSYVGPLRGSRSSLEAADAARARPPGWVRAIDRAGGRLERWAGRRADGWIALTHESGRVMRSVSTMPGRVIPPPLPDPQRVPDRPDPAALARGLGLEPNGFLLYSGNLDAYQELDLLAAAATRRERGARARLPVVVATHGDAEGGGDSPEPKRRDPKEDSGLRFVRIESAARMRALLQAARASVVPRRAEGGFPVKLVNSLAAGTVPIVFHDREWGLRDGLDALVADDRDPVAGLARALTRVEDEPELARRLGAGARETYLRRHRPEVVAAETLALIEAVIATREARGAGLLRRVPADGAPEPERAR